MSTPGWKLVPAQATHEMRKAAVLWVEGDDVYDRLPIKVLTVEEDVYGEIYEAMLAASPAQQVDPIDTSPKHVEETENHRHDAWLRVIDEAMICAHLGTAEASDDYATAKRKLNALLAWHESVGADPAIGHQRPLNEGGGWIEWAGGDRPTGIDVNVDVEIRYGEIAERVPACDLDWHHRQDDGDIIRYRISRGDE